MTEEQREERLKSLLNLAFLQKLREAARLYGWYGDYAEISAFVRSLYIDGGLNEDDYDFDEYQIE